MMQFHTCHTYFTGIDHDAVLQAAVGDSALYQSDGQVQSETTECVRSGIACYACWAPGLMGALPLPAGRPVHDVNQA